MIYCYCDQCGLAFRKGHYKNPKCLRCGNPDLWEEDIPREELTLADQVADEMLRESVRKGGQP
mgnify:FL=1